MWSRENATITSFKLEWMRNKHQREKNFISIHIKQGRKWPNTIFFNYHFTRRFKVVLSKQSFLIYTRLFPQAWRWKLEWSVIMLEFRSNFSSRLWKELRANERKEKRKKIVKFGKSFQLITIVHDNIRFHVTRSFFIIACSLRMLMITCCKWGRRLTMVINSAVINRKAVWSQNRLKARNLFVNFLQDCNYFSRIRCQGSFFW